MTEAARPGPLLDDVRPRPRSGRVLPAALVVVLLVVSLGWQQAARRADAVTADRAALASAVQRACSSYASLDLSDLVQACRAVGYQQVVGR